MQSVKSSFDQIGTLSGLKDFEIGEMKFPELKIGELATKTESLFSSEAEKMEEQIPVAQPVVVTIENAAQQVADYAGKHWPLPPKIPVPPPISSRLHLKR
jgi:hypothetical protein